MVGSRHLRRLVKKERDEIARKFELIERQGVEKEIQREVAEQPVPEEQPISHSAEQRMMAAFSRLEKKLDVLSQTLAEAVALLKLQIKKEPDLSPNAMELEHFTQKF
ncbi:uncharacterized protein [Drosophila pseudoobscura]|uniref:Tubulin-specific chaperone A n=1 Tax=Drosophila pseudoobscura pseudoobscura TaxID=46245 RepID=A0A6I8WAY9_DROPS|nr:uncharacterized protein LOC26532193 [Drosophila pseudoobscura]